MGWIVASGVPFLILTFWPDGKDPKAEPPAKKRLEKILLFFVIVMVPLILMANTDLSPIIGIFWIFGSTVLVLDFWIDRAGARSGLVSGTEENLLIHSPSTIYPVAYEYKTT